MTNVVPFSAKQQSEVVRACKHLLDKARAGRLIAIGYALVEFDDQGDVNAGNNAVWTDDIRVRDALKTALGTLEARIGAKGGIILQ